MNQLQPITKELMNSLGLNRHKAINKYHQWLKKVRAQEKEEVYLLADKIRRHNHMNMRLHEISMCGIQYQVYMKKDGSIGECFSI